MNKNYEFLGIDEGKQNIFRANTLDGSIKWIKSLSNYPIARSMQRLDENTIILGYERGYCIMDIRDGNILHDCSKWKDVTSVYRCDNGNTLITGQDLVAENNVCVLTLDSNDEVINTSVQEGDYVRLMSITKDNKYLLSTNDHIRICDTNLNIIKKLYAKEFLHAWQSHQMDDGSYLVSGGYGGLIVHFSSEGEILSTFGKAEDVPNDVEPFFYAAFDFDSDGNILAANWQGHGPDNGNKGRQLVLFDPTGKYLDSWSFSDTVSSLQGFLLL